MSDKLARIPASRSHQMLARILEQPALVAGVQALAPRTLARLIDHVGLEDSGELIALATPAQLQGLLDQDLWKAAAPGQDERFDPARFTLWLEVMLEAGDDFVADKLAELSEDLVTLALSQQVLVVDLDDLGTEVLNQEVLDVDLTAKALDSCLCQEIAEYRVICTRPSGEGWDAVVAALLALDQRHHEYLRRVLARCCHLSNQTLSDGGGLYEVLMADDLLTVDATADREDRRAREGYIPPSQARAFLALARTSSLADMTATRAADPITRAYFRELQPVAAAPPGRQEPGVARLVAMLEQAEVDGGTAPAAPAQLAGQQAPPDSLFQRAMVELAEREPSLHAKRMAELGFLANVLIAGDTRPRRPIEAAEAVIATCSRGLAHLLAQPEAMAAGDLIARESAAKLFRIGWKLASK